jgi:hypothetical protein
MGMVKNKRDTLTGYLDWYYTNVQEKIMLVHRETRTCSWANRALFLSEEYNPITPYNHRSILYNEVVIEYDYEDKELNEKLATLVTDRLRDDKIKYSKWFSGGKSYHVHILVNPNKCRNISLLKNVICRYYGTFYKNPEDGKIYKEKKSETFIKIIPDIRLCAENHLIRAEYGAHEGTGNLKTLVSKSPGYPEVCEITEDVWKEYIKQQSTVIMRRVSTDVNKITDLPGFKYIATSHLFREAEDGRERAMFILIHSLKDDYRDDKVGFIRYIQDWYKYSGGYKITDNQIKHKVCYHWDKSYSLNKFLNDLLESIGREDLILKNNGKNNC